MIELKARLRFPETPGRFVVQWRMPVGVILLGLAFAAFPKYVKPYFTAWLFPDGEPEKEP